MPAARCIAGLLFFAMPGLGLMGACSDRKTENGGDGGSGTGTSGDSGSESGDGGGSLSTSDSTSASSGISTSASSGDTGDADTGDEPCTDFASGALSKDSKVPGEQVTALGVTLVFESISDTTLGMVFSCSSNGEQLEALAVPQGGEPNSGARFDVEVEGQSYEVSFEWVPGDDIEYSVAIEEL